MKGVSVVTGTKNDCELIEFFIHHHLRLGFQKLHIMDFNSTDGTREILQKYIGHPQLDIILSDEDHGKPHLHRWLRFRAYLEPSTDHILYLDADEMMVLPPRTTIENIVDGAPNVINEFPRYNIVNPAPLKNGLSEKLLANLHRMYFHTPLPKFNFPIQPENEWIEWIKQPIPGKVLHAKVPVHVSLGGHYAMGSTIDKVYSSGKAFIAHLPVTTYKRMIDKIISLKGLIDSSPHLKSLFIRYVRICYVYDIGLAEDMFNRIYLSPEEIKSLVAAEQISSGKTLLSQNSDTIVVTNRDISTYPGQNYQISMELALQSLQTRPTSA